MKSAGWKIGQPFAVYPRQADNPEPRLDFAFGTTAVVPTNSLTRSFSLIALDSVKCKQTFTDLRRASLDDALNIVLRDEEMENRMTRSTAKRIAPK